jgi:hypothetical protein
MTLKPDDKVAARYEEEAQQELTEAKARLEAKKKVRLQDGPYDLGWFSPPGEALRCEHPLLRLMIRGGLPLYFCDDCEWGSLITSATAIPKQHIPAYGLFMNAWFLKYEGPKALAEALIRPHPRNDLEGHPELPPIEVVREMKEQWAEVMGHLSAYEAEALEEAKNGSKELPSAEAE